MSVVVSIRVRREVLRLVDEMIRYGLASSRNEALNLLIRIGMDAAMREVERRKRVEEMVEKFEKRGGIALDRKTDVVRELRELRE